MKALPKITGFEVERELGEGTTSVVYRALRDGKAFAIKVLKNKFSKDAVAFSLRFRREVAALARLDHPGLVKVIEAGEQDGLPFFVMELAEGRDLSRLLKEGPLPVGVFLPMARTITSAFAEVHRYGLVHRDIKPGNIMVSSEGAPKAIDFGLAAMAEEDGKNTGQEAVGTFLYAAPEQAGTLRRPVDNRSDLYSLGVVYFECLTGRPPFLSEDLPDLLRDHLSTPPPHPLSLNPSIGQALAQIILKLLAKDPDDRYQTAEGLLEDLSNVDRLNAEFAALGKIKLGTKDFSAWRTYQTKLVGRDPELQRLRSVYDQLKDGVGSAVLIEGMSGSGKTRLVREVLELACHGGALILSGKCTQAGQMPFGPIREALDEYILQAYKLPQNERETAFQGIRDAAGDFSALLRGLSNGLGQVLKQGPSQVESTEQQGQERFLEAAAYFLAQLARARGPILLFVDDIQWLDDASRGILARLADQLDTAPVLLVAASRDDAQSESAKNKFIDQLGGMLGTRLCLQPLSQEAVAELVSQHLGGHHLDPSVVARLLDRSQGNPFVIGEYLRNWLESGALHPSIDGWVLEATAFDRLTLSTNILDLVLGRIATLRPEVIELLRIAAVIGSRFELDLLSKVAKVERNKVAYHLLEAVRASLIEQVSAETYGFVHDRVSEAFLKDRDEERIKDLHQAVAESLDQSKDVSTETLFALARHYSSGHTSRNPERVWRANLTAGARAIENFADEEAHGFLSFAYDFVKARGLPLSPVLGERLGEACWKTGRAEEACGYLREALKGADDSFGRARIQYLIGQSEFSASRMKIAFNEYVRAFHELGMFYPRSRWSQYLSIAYYGCLALMVNRTGWGRGAARGRLAERLRLATLICTNSQIAAYVSMDRLHLVLLPLLNFCFTSSLGSDSEIVESDSRAGTFLAFLGFRRLAHFFTKRAVEAAARTGHPMQIGRARLYHGWALEYEGRCREAEPLLASGIEEAGRWMSSFDYVMACGILARNALIRGHAQSVLHWHENLTVKYERALRLSRGKDTKRRSSFSFFHGITLQPLILLARPVEAAAVLRQAEQAAREAPPTEPMTKLLFLSYKLIYFLELEEFGAPAEDAISAYAALGIKPEVTPTAAQHFYIAQAYIRLFQFLPSKREKKDLFQSALRELRIVSRFSRNILCHVYIIEALLDHADGNTKKALKKLSDADVMAAEEDNSWGLFEVARARARFYLQQGNKAAAGREARNAHGIALEQGWISRASRIKTEFDLEERGVAISGDGAKASTSLSPTASAASFSGGASHRLKRHLEALLQVSLAAASTFGLKEQARVALDEVVKILGAERAFLFLLERQDGGGLVFEAGRDSFAFDLTEPRGYSTTIVKKAADERKAVVVSGTEEGIVLGSESVVVHDLRSIMAAPVLIRDRLIGVVYLDTHLTKGLFGEADVEILTAICNHIAIAIENAKAAQVAIEKQAMQKDLEVTGAVQQLFIPGENEYADQGIQLAGFYRPASQSGGDWWWYQPLDGRLLVLLGDVTGHGAGAAMVTAAAAGFFRLLVKFGYADNVRSLLEEMDNAIHELCRKTYLMSLCAVEVDSKAKKLRYWGAGAPPIFIARARSRSVEVVSAGGAPLGMNNRSYGFTEVDLAPGDRAFVFSDCAYEMTDRSGIQVRRKGLMNIYQELCFGQGDIPSLRDMRSELTQTFDRILDGREQDDDLTFVLFGLEG